MKKLLVLIILAVSIGHSMNAQAQDAKIQAVFILKFVDNIIFPQEKKDLVIGVVGKSEVFAELESRLKLKNPNGIVVKRISPEEVVSVDVIYLPKNEIASLPGIRAAINAKSILMITESDLSRKGSSISFVETEGKLSFIVNRNVIESAGLRITSTLLTLGKQS